jgi:hypothetical protein
MFFAEIMGYMVAIKIALSALCFYGIWRVRQARAGNEESEDIPVPTVVASVEGKDTTIFV